MICAQTRVPGISVSQVARRYDVNANPVFTWLRDGRFSPDGDTQKQACFLPVEIIADVRHVNPGVKRVNVPVQNWTPGLI